MTKLLPLLKIAKTHHQITNFKLTLAKIKIKMKIKKKKNFRIIIKSILVCKWTLLHTQVGYECDTAQSCLSAVDGVIKSSAQSAASLASSHTQTMHWMLPLRKTHTQKNPFWVLLFFDVLDFAVRPYANKKKIYCILNEEVKLF